MFPESMLTGGTLLGPGICTFSVVSLQVSICLGRERIETYSPNRRSETLIVFQLTAQVAVLCPQLFNLLVQLRVVLRKVNIVVVHFGKINLYPSFSSSNCNLSSDSVCHGAHKSISKTQHAATSTFVASESAFLLPALALTKRKKKRQPMQRKVS